MERMDERYFIREYKLAEDSLRKIELLREALKDDIPLADPAWKFVGGKAEEVVTSDEEKIESDKEDEKESALESTQFYFTQVDRSACAKQSAPLHAQREDIIECLCEGLERANGKLDLSQLESLSDEELPSVVSTLENRLSATGTYNLCCSMNSMNLDQRMRYSTVLYSRFLLPKIIGLQEPSRLLSTAIAESAEKFPDDIQKFIFVPLLNVDLKDTTVASAIASNFGPQRRATLITEFVEAVNELKAWHIPILQSLISLKTDSRTNDKLLRLFSASALHFAKEKNFGKLLLSFIKVNASFSDGQKVLLREIIGINETFFKKPMENILRTL